MLWLQAGLHCGTLLPEWYGANKQPKDSTPPSVPRFNTILRPLGPGRPKESPVEYTHFPLSQYTCRGLLYNLALTRSQLDEIKDRCNEAWLGGNKGIRQAGSDSVQRYRKLADWLHVETRLCHLRPLLADELDLAAGFPAGASVDPTVEDCHG